MTLTNFALDSVDQHWAVSALDSAIRDRALEVAKVRLVRSAVGRQLQIDFEEKHSDVESLHRAATAYEVAAIEGIEELLHPSPTKEGVLRRDQAQAGAFRAYQIRRSLPVPSNDEERVFHILHLASLAY